MGNIFKWLRRERSIDRMNEFHELGVHRRNARLLMEDGRDRRKLCPIIGYCQEPLLPLAAACAPLVDIVEDIFRYVSIALEHTPDKPADGLTRSESASIRLYTMEWREARSLYSNLNHALRRAGHEDLHPWYKYLKLFLTALAKMPCVPPQVVWRGVRKNISAEFLHGSEVTWWEFSSCTIALSVLENSLYLGNVGERTLFSIEIINGRNIRPHSQFENEDEILMLPGTCMKVQAKLNPAPDLHIIHLKQKIPEAMLIEPPFKSIWNFFSWLC